MIDQETKIEALIRAYCRRRKASLWGQSYWIVPAYCPHRFGDGLQVVWFEPMDTRPDIYILRVDSRWSTRNTERNPLCDYLNEIYEAIESCFGAGYEEWEADNGRTYKRHNPFPALSMSSGCACWGEMEIDWK